MTRITPASNSIQVPDLEDHEPYKATLKEIGWSNSSPEYGGEPRLELDWLIDGDISTIRDWISLRLGKQQSGQVSKLRALLNAISGKPEGTEIAWFDDETLEVSYDGETAYNVLKVGVEVILRGVTTAKEDGSKRFAIKVYQPVKARSAANSRKPMPVGAVARGDQVDIEDVPF